MMTTPLLLTAAMILLPLVSLCEPAVLVEVGVHVFVVSTSDHRMNMSSCVELVAIVVSVPNRMTCLSSPETSMILLAVGALL